MKVTWIAVPDEVRSSLRRTSTTCRLLCAVLCAGFLLSQSDTVFDLLSISVAGLGTQLWTVFTYWLAERNALVLLLDLVCVHLAGTVLEPLWSPAELARFSAAVALSVGVCGTLALLLPFVLGVDAEEAFVRSVHGMAGFDGAVLVGVKQILPDSVIVATRLGRLKNTHLPGLAVVVLVALSLVRAVTWVVPAMCALGLLSGWTYLRFYQRHPNGLKGDMSEHFSFASLFPSRMHACVSAASRPVYKCFVRLSLCQPAVRRYVDVAQLDAVAVATDADRRRQKALRELTERLERAKAESRPQQWPDMEADGDDEDDGGGELVAAATHGTPQMSPVPHVAPAAPAADAEPLVSVAPTQSAVQSTHDSTGVA